ncbi:PREDICTED: peptidyl-prolyl cis-trans isomerase FKBP1A-like isoform X1 [Priapulus caudatus]|uniref:peptidylprolyl isomerase n=1 Tax=Priapulus caudatus TaxID=37621 RepID=A0ABM1ES77_PRICU|nr:PREDICTED: peptidyl-prolyl cis-trans isomerase FKBP1A-like isoform X1 [Priapulus caudatus]
MNFLSNNGACVFCVFLTCLALTGSKKARSFETIIEQASPSCSQTAEVGDTVAVQYTGILENGQVFDTSRREGRGPFTFVLGQKQVIPGWEKGVVGMCVGEIRKLIIPPELAYGSKGVPPQIPGDATLLFQVELVAVEKATILPRVLSLVQLLAVPCIAVYTIYYCYTKYQEQEQKLKDSRKQKKRR